MQAVLNQIEHITDNIETRWFRPEKPFSYIAGQFIEMRLAHDQPDDRGEKRWFTLSSSPTEDLIAMTTRFTPEHSSSFKTTLQHLKVGDEVTISEPMGDFVLPKDSAIPLVLIAGGMGITPMRSMIKWLLDKGEKRTVHLLYAVQEPSQLAFMELFAQYGITPEVILSQPPASWSGRTGHLTAASILDFAGQNAEQLIYLSGPEPMVESLHKQLIDRGVNPNRLVEDYFPGYTT
jgi:glycine betaine catabolism B